MKTVTKTEINEALGKIGLTFPHTNQSDEWPIPLDDDGEQFSVDELQATLDEAITGHLNVWERFEDDLKRLADYLFHMGVSCEEELTTHQRAVLEQIILTTGEMGFVWSKDRTAFLTSEAFRELPGAPKRRASRQYIAGLIAEQEGATA